MAEGIPFAFPVDLTRKWRALAERRKAHLVDLYDSGRWRRYYSEQDYILRLREAIRAVERWSATEQSAVREAAMPPIDPAEAVGRVPSGDAEDEDLPRVGVADTTPHSDAEDNTLSTVEAFDGESVGEVYQEDAIDEASVGEADKDELSAGDLDGEMLSAPEAELERESA